MYIWFTSDTHFGAERTLELSKRPFDSVDCMDDAITLRWEFSVGPDDIVYHLGDFGDPSAIHSLSGKEIYLLPGNYDTDEILEKITKDPRVTIIKPNHEITLEGQKYKLIHEPEEGNDPDAFYLYGHIHKLQMVKRNGLNVGTDCHQFTPIDADTVLFYRDAIENFYDKNVFMESIPGK